MVSVQFFVSNLVFKTLLKINKKNDAISFLQFASEHLPDHTTRSKASVSNNSSNNSPSSATKNNNDDENGDDVDCSQFVLKSLATIFRRFPELNNEFPPKCRLFDFVVSVGQNYPDNDDVYRCISTLLPIPPVNQTEQIPIITSLIMNSTKITDELLLMLKSTLMVAENPGDIKLLLEPFVKQLNQSIIKCRKNRKKIRFLYNNSEYANSNSTLNNYAVNNNNNDDIENIVDSDEDYFDDFEDCLNGIHYSLLLSILDSLAGHGNSSNSSSGYSTQDNNDFNSMNNNNNNEQENVNSDDSLDFDFPPLGIDASSKLKLNEKASSNVSYDSFLEMMAESIGICLPIFEKAHLAVHYILIIMGRLTQKFD